MTQRRPRKPFWLVVALFVTRRILLPLTKLFPYRNLDLDMAKKFGSKLEKVNQQLTENRLVNRAIAIIKSRDVETMNSHIERMSKHSGANATRLLTEAFQRSKLEDLNWWKEQGVAIATNLELQTDVG